ncbi:MAG: class II fumarate hydratase [Thermoplasmata archaeon]
MEDYRTERDFLGKVRVPRRAYWGVQTQRAVENFPVSGLRLQRRFIRAQGIIKLAAAKANMEVGRLDGKMGEAIVKAAREVMEGRFDDHFVVDVYQAGAGTSQNMNANEVIANRANEILGGELGAYKPVHPNDHVNMAQSTNDTIHVAIHIAALEAIQKELLPALEGLAQALRQKAKEFDDIVKIGRTHLQDAVPVRLGQEFSGYASMIEHSISRLGKASASLEEIVIGGTAVGTGLNADPRYPDLAIREINTLTGLRFRRPDDMFEAMQNTDACMDTSGTLKAMAVSLTKIANDLRLLSSGPRTGLAEIELPAVQPGSSIMPGKVNPVIAEMLNMVAFQVLGNDATITYASQAGQLELNVMMPVIAYNLIQSIEIAIGGIGAFTERCVQGIKADRERCRSYVEWSTAMATALSPRIGYERAAEIAKKAYAEGRTVREVALEDSALTPEELDDLLDASRMTKILED